MRNNTFLTYDTSRYDTLPVSVLIYEILEDGAGNFVDYKIVYGNRKFGEDYRRIYEKEFAFGEYVIKNRMMDEYTLQIMAGARRGKALHSFSTYVPIAKLHIHMEPITDLPEGYMGFLITDIGDYDEQESRVHFLRVVSQMNNNACLYLLHEDGGMSVQSVTPSFCEMMEFASTEEAMKVMGGEGVLTTTFVEDRDKVVQMLRCRKGEDGARDLTIRKITARGRVIWCSAHYAFIDDYEEHFVYCTYTDVTVLKKYEDQLQSIYQSLGNNFYQTGSDTLVRLRANLTQDLIEEEGSTMDFGSSRMNMPYTRYLQERVGWLPIEHEQEEFLRIFSIPSLTRDYMDGHVTASRVLYSRLPDETVSYVKFTVNVTRHPLSGDLVAFITEDSNNPEKLASTIQGKILAKQFDLVAYIARDRYDVAIGDSALIEHGNIFPKEKSGSYCSYIDSQVIPALRRDPAYRQEIRHAMSLETVFEMLKVREPYAVDIELETEEGIFYKRFDFYSVDPESEYCIVLKTDTTRVRLEQKRQEENARELETSRQELADADDIITDAGFGMWHIVLEDGRAPRMRGNEKMMELLGVAGQELTEEEVYDAWYSRILPEDIPSVEKSVGEMLEGRLSENTYRWKHPRQGVLYVRCGGAAKALEEHRTLLRGYHSDVTHIVREEMMQREALSNALAAAEHANRAKTAFLNNMSHDIRTPMNAIVGFTALASSHIENTEQVKDYLSKITVSSQHLLSLINDVLDMSRIESGKMTLDESEIHLPELIHDLRTIIQANVSAKRQELSFDTQNVVNEDIIVDKLRLNQIFLNILSNAIKFTPAGGKISFRVIEKPSLSTGMTDFEFRIKDTGIGMSEEFQKTIFEAFTREKTSTVSGIQGTGLGMAITKSIVDMMGGTIYVDSEPGRGSEFVVNIPCKLSSRRTTYEEIPELKGMRVLVADDDTNTCLSVCSMLREIGMHPDWTNYGKEAVIRAKDALDQKDPFRVYIVDWQMPDMNGIEAIRRIRRVAGDDASIIVMTAYDWADIEEEAREAGVTSFCAKPLFMSELRSVLEDPFRKDEKKKEAEEEKVDFSGKKILLAEDNEVNQIIAVAILQEAGFEVDIAANGRIAVEKMETSPADTYDIILMDIQMPEMNGYEAASIIRNMEDPAKAGIPIVAVTANAFEEDRKLALEAGMNGHLAKPYDIPDMLATIASLVK